MPSTLPSKVPVARNERRYGIRIEKISSRPVERADREDRERRGLLGLVQRLGGRHLHRLLLGHELALHVAGDGDQQARRRGARRRRPGGRPERRRRRRVGHGPCASATPRSPATNAPAVMNAAGDRVRERDQRRGVGQHARRSRSARPGRCRVERVADRVLHPGVGGEDEVRRQDGADRPRSRSWPGGRLCGSRSQPKIQSPRNVDSRKNASRPSIASGAPKMSPTNRL